MNRALRNCDEIENNLVPIVTRKRKQLSSTSWIIRKMVLKDAGKVGVRLGKTPRQDTRFP